MFYQESYKSLWFEKNQILAEQMDYLLGTLSGDLVNRITVTYISDKLDIHLELAKQLLQYYEAEGILKRRYLVTCPKCDSVLFICDEDQLFNKIEENPFCIECECSNYNIGTENIFIIFERLKKSTSSQEEIKETLRKHGDIVYQTKSEFSFFNFADSLNEDEMFEIFYHLDESAIKKLNLMHQEILSEQYNTTKEKGDGLEILVQNVFELGSHFKTSRKFRTNTNQLDVTILCPIKFVIPSVFDVLSPYFICECKNEKETPGNTYYHKLASILTNMGEHGAKLAILVSRYPCASTCKSIAHDKYLHDNIVIINITLDDLKKVIDKKINLLKLISIKINAITINSEQQLKDNGLI